MITDFTDVKMEWRPGAGDFVARPFDFRRLRTAEKIKAARKHVERLEARWLWFLVGLVAGASALLTAEAFVYLLIAGVSP